ncbi:MAG TPA: hypothetical protein VL500_00540 [Candidatus Eisenbacteria bacterium]|nr:hypothetical protein [Candidatus Eisenbacteria bacterium]
MTQRTRMMMQVALQHAQAAFASSCGRKGHRGCRIYEGSVWNAGTHATVIVDRGSCDDHGTRPAFADVEVWIYDIRGDSIVYLGKDRDPDIARLLKEPGGAPPPAKSWPPKKN